MKIRVSLVVLTVVPLAIVGTLPLQKLFAQKQSFEVATIRKNTSGRSGASISTSGGRFVATNATVKLLINYAYPPSKGRYFLSTQIVGGPSWLDTEHFDIQAKPEGETRARPVEEMQSLVRALLEDRFSLRVHRETREQQVYNLVVAKPGKLAKSADQTPPSPAAAGGAGTRPDPTAPPPRGISRVMNTATKTQLSARAVRLTSLAMMLQGQLEHIVIDRTGLTELYDIDLEFDPRQNNPASLIGNDLTAPLPADLGVSLFTAVQEQLGLKLQTGKGPVEVLVIDDVQKPSDN
jgi:uncharacterized protein (TIGR03435 family)